MKLPVREIARHQPRQAAPVTGQTDLTAWPLSAGLRENLYGPRSRLAVLRSPGSKLRLVVGPNPQDMGP